GTLALTDLSTEVLRGERPVMLRRDPPKVAPLARGGRGAGDGVSGVSGVSGAGGGRSRRVVARIPAVELPAEAEAVFERLRAWRTVTAKEQGMPPYVIFHDATLRQIAATPPATLAEL